MIFLHVYTLTAIIFIQVLITHRINLYRKFLSLKIPPPPRPD